MANKMGTRQRRQRTPRYHCLSDLGHEETFTKLLPAWSKRPCPSIRSRFSCLGAIQANPASYPADQRFARKRFSELLLFSTVREYEFCCGSWLFFADQSAHGHHFFWTYGSLSSRHTQADATYLRILLGSIRPPRGRQSRNESGTSKGSRYPLSLTIATTLLSASFFLVPAFFRASLLVLRFRINSVAYDPTL